LATLTYNDFIKDVNDGNIQKIIVTEGKTTVKIIKK